MLVVIAGVIAKRAFECVLIAARVCRVRLDVAFEDDFCAGRYLQLRLRQGWCEARREFRSAAAQQAPQLNTANAGLQPGLVVESVEKAGAAARSG